MRSPAGAVGVAASLNSLKISKQVLNLERAPSAACVCAQRLSPVGCAPLLLEDIQADVAVLVHVGVEAGRLEAHRGRLERVICMPGHPVRARTAVLLPSPLPSSNRMCITSSRRQGCRRRYANQSVIRQTRVRPLCRQRSEDLSFLSSRSKSYPAVVHCPTHA